jgi:hypothetical protein
VAARDRFVTPVFALVFLLGAALACGTAGAAGVLAHDTAASQASFNGETPSAPARLIADWAVRSGDPQGRPFAIVDKLESRVFVFDAQGRLRGASPALLGLAQGDESVPGIGTRLLSSIRPDERTTPAGRFEASLERSLNGDEILWVDYDTAIALHRVVELPRERRLQRLAGKLPAERRITYGCINVPVKFFDDVVAPQFRGTPGVVYVLPERRALSDVFELDRARQ